jgi:hypothetical protein
MSWTIRLQDLPLGMYNEIWFWLYHNDIGDMKKQAELTGGYVDEVTITMSDEETTLFRLKWL